LINPSYTRNSYIPMTQSKTLEIEGMRYTVRGLIFEELVHLGQVNIDGDSERMVITEITGCCLVAPKRNSREINCTGDKVLTQLAREVLKMS
jgi:hypothetical protein